MDFLLSTEQKLLINSIHEFCLKNIDPNWIKIDDEARFPPEIIKELSRLGVHGGVLSEEFGGSDMSFLDVALVQEELSSHDPTLVTAGVVGLSNSWPYIVQTYGSSEAKGELLPKITSGDAILGIASTEAQGGTDLAGIQRVQARKISEDRWIVEGEKSIVSGGALMDSMPWGGGWFLLSRTAPIETRHKGLTNFIIYRKKDGRIVDGVSYSRYKHMGRHALDSDILNIKVEVDDKYRVGGVNDGFRVAVEGFNLGRTFIGGSILGGVKWLINQGLQWIRERKIFGQPLSSYQGVSFELAKIYEELEAARLLVYKAAWLADRYYKKKDPTVKPIDIGVAGAAAKTKATEVALRASEEIMQWFGGMAYFTELPVFRALLGAFAYIQGAEGAPKALRDLIARSIVEGRVRIE
jgi:acyl-CoA dehydrogenase